MTFTLESPQGPDAIAEFVAFHDTVYEARPIRHLAQSLLIGMTLGGEGPFAEGRTFKPVLARRSDGTIAARAIGVVDQHYLHRWDDSVGHVAGFEALPDTLAESRAVLDEVCGWLREQGMVAARAGSGGFLTETPFAIDDYDTLPPSIIRQNPAYYHSLLKDSGFETEKGWVDYKIEVTPALIERWKSMVESVGRVGVELVPFGEVDPSRRIDDFLSTWNSSFHNHWGMAPLTRGEIELIAAFLGPAGMDAASMLAYRDGAPVGVLWVTPGSKDEIVTSPGREIRDDEVLNFLGIGVLDSARGQGVNLAMAAKSYLHLVDLGAKYVSYTLVLDDNWPSRRTGEKLGGHVCGSYLVYRRNFTR